MRPRPIAPPRRGSPARRAAVALTGLMLVPALAGCGASATPIPPAAVVGVDVRPDTPPPRPTSPFRFKDVAADAGIDFVHFSGMTKDKHFPTMNGSGAAVLDYDGDGRMDLYFATGCLLPLGTAESRPNRLYRNRGDGTFEDVTERSGLGFRGFNHGVVVGDIDNDGDPDVFLCNYGGNRLFENNGDGTFRDISAAAGVDRPAWWSSGGAFLDYDNDGDLDLYVANYGLWSLPEDDRFCTHELFRYAPGEEKVRVYCAPQTIRTGRHVLYRNNGDRTFTDVTDAAGVGRSDGHGFSATAADLDGDGDTDLYVANDSCPNFLFLNNGDGTFKDATEGSGAAFDERGHTQAGMGSDAEDTDGDGRPELFVTNFKDEPNVLYRNLGRGLFADVAFASGLGRDSLPYISWGCGLVDLDNDGWPDAFVANGHVDDNLAELGKSDPYAQPPLLHRNDAGRRFVLASPGAGDYFDTPHVARGVAFGDLDDDGRLDIVVNHKDGPPAVLRNDTKSGNHWVRLQLVGTRSNRDAVGARVEVRAGARTIYRQRKGGASMESAHDPRLLVGLGPADEVEALTIRWPSGAVTRRTHLAADRSYRIVEPEGREDGR